MTTYDMLVSDEMDQGMRLAVVNKAELEAQR